MAIPRLVSIATLVGSVSLMGCDAANRAHEETVKQRKERERVEQIEAGAERVRLKQEGYTLTCNNIISKEVPNVFGSGNPGFIIGLIDNGLLLDGGDDYYEMGSRLKSNERLRMARNYALSITVEDKVVKIINRNEQGGFVEKRLTCQ